MISLMRQLSSTSLSTAVTALATSRDRRVNSGLKIHGSLRFRSTRICHTATEDALGRVPATALPLKQRRPGRRPESLLHGWRRAATRPSCQPGMTFFARSHRRRFPADGSRRLSRKVSPSCDPVGQLRLCLHSLAELCSLARPEKTHPRVL